MLTCILSAVNLAILGRAVTLTSTLAFLTESRLSTVQVKLVLVLQSQPAGHAPLTATTSEHNTARLSTSWFMTSVQ